MSVNGDIQPTSQRVAVVAWVLSSLVLAGLFSGRAASAQPGGSPLQNQILQAVTALQATVDTLQSSLNTLEQRVISLQNAVDVLDDELVGAGRSDVRFTSTVLVAPDENAGCNIVNISSSSLQIHTQLIDTFGATLSETTLTLAAGHATSGAGLNQPGGNSQMPVYCKFTVLTPGRSRSDIRGAVHHVQRRIVVPAE